MSACSRTSGVIAWALWDLLTKTLCVSFVPTTTLAHDWPAGGFRVHVPRGTILDVPTGKDRLHSFFVHAVEGQDDGEVSVEP